MTQKFGVNYKAKRMFFDRPKVINRIGKAKAKKLSKFGAFVRTNARTKQLRRRKKAADAGSPPSVHSRDKVANLKNIAFALEGADKVVTGPLLLNQKQYSGAKLTTGTVPKVMEFGGTVGLREKQVGKVWRPVGRRKPRPGQKTRVRKARYAAHPFMLPALIDESPKFPDLWANSISG